MVHEDGYVYTAPIKFGALVLQGKAYVSATCHSGPYTHFLGIEYRSDNVLLKIDFGS